MTSLDVLTDLFGSDPVDLHGAMIVDAGGLAQLVIERLAEARFLNVPADAMMRWGRATAAPFVWTDLLRLQGSDAGHPPAENAPAFRV